MALLSRTRAALVVLSLVAAGPRTFAQPPLEDEVKAVFLFNFAKYVDWPQAAQGGSATIRICVPANPPFLALVRQAVQDEVVNGRPLTAINLDGLDNARECDIIYVGGAKTPDAAAWIDAVRGRPVLTVGDGGLIEGLVIAFVRDKDRLRFDINRPAASRQKLSISSRLLGLARRVDP
ncbi:MAG TPA: YfiR family protein [Vicinamibacterales bacterium]|nr:YfiR family protein [Vicinamibacterales bacterium]